MSSFEITGVRTDETAGDSHEHITAVRIGTNEAVISRSTVVTDLRSPNGDRYYTFGGGERAAVVVRECPRCSYSDYITTLPDSTKKNNLLKLPRI
jgi:Protein of unknown function (DUF3892)